MTGEYIIIAVIVAAAVAYLLLVLWNKYVAKKGGGCGCGCGPKTGAVIKTKAKHASLTLNGRTVRR